MFDGICFPANGATPLGLPSVVFRVCSHRLGSGTAAPSATPARKPTAPSGTANVKTTWPAISASPANSASKAGKSSASGNCLRLSTLRFGSPYPLRPASPALVGVFRSAPEFLKRSPPMPPRSMRSLAEAHCLATIVQKRTPTIRS